MEAEPERKIDGETIIGRLLDIKSRARNVKSNLQGHSMTLQEIDDAIKGSDPVEDSKESEVQKYDSTIYAHFNELNGILNDIDILLEGNVGIASRIHHHIMG